MDDRTTMKNHKLANGIIGKVAIPIRRKDLNNIINRYAGKDEEMQLIGRYIDSVLWVIVDKRNKPLCYVSKRTGRKNRKGEYNLYI